MVKMREKDKKELMDPILWTVTKRRVFGKPPHLCQEASSPPHVAATPPPTPSQHSPGWNHVGPVRRLRGHILGSTAGKTRWKRAPLGSPRSPAAAARTTVVALRQPPGSYNWAYDLLQVGRGGGKPRKCNLKKRISHSDKNLMTRRVVGTLRQRSVCSLHFEWARAAQQKKLVEAAQQGG